MDIVKRSSMGVDDGATISSKVDQKEVGKWLSISVHQIKRIARRYRTEGLPGLMSKKRGIPSNRRLNE